MKDLLIKLDECIEFGKINLASPYPPQMKGQEGADEIIRRALEEGVAPTRNINSWTDARHGTHWTEIS